MNEDQHAPANEYDVILDAIQLSDRNKAIASTKLEIEKQNSINMPAPNAINPEQIQKVKSTRQLGQVQTMS